MEAEHDGIDPALGACADGLRAMVEHPCDDHRNALVVAVSEARSALLAHLAHEEGEALPLLQRRFSDADFAATEKAAQGAYPLRMVGFLLPWVADGLPAAAMARILAEAPPGYGALLRLAAPALRPAGAPRVPVRLSPPGQGSAVPRRGQAGGRPAARCSRTACRAAARPRLRSPALS